MGESFPMNGGDGDYSYAKNSQFQKLATDAVKEMIQEAVIQNLDRETLTTTVSIADFGCSVGPNTFSAVQNLIQSVQHKLHHDSLIEFQVFFNDHSSNDFNTLFASLPPGRQYYAAGVPGSFHGRLFPRASITLAHSSYSLQLLSQPPQGVLNEGRIHSFGSSDDVARAYSDQFRKDLEGFMSARAEEIVRGGLMFLALPVTPDGGGITYLELGVVMDYLASGLMDLVDQGVVEKEAVDAFNLPVHLATVREIREVVEKNGCFSIERTEVLDPRAKAVEGRIDATSVIKHLRAGLEGVFKAHFGNDVVDKMFDNVSGKTEEISRCLEGTRSNSHDQLFVVLKRK